MGVRQLFGTVRVLAVVHVHNPMYGYFSLYRDTRLNTCTVASPAVLTVRHRSSARATVLYSSTYYPMHSGVLHSVHHTRVHVPGNEHPACQFHRPAARHSCFSISFCKPGLFFPAAAVVLRSPTNPNIYGALPSLCPPQTRLGCNISPALTPPTPPPTNHASEEQVKKVSCGAESS